MKTQVSELAASAEWGSVSSPQESSFRWSLVLAIAVGILYAILPTKNYYWDGISFSQQIEGAGGLNASLFHPNHLIYNHLGYLGWSWLNALGFHVRALAVLQAISVVSAAACICLLHRILCRITRSAYVSTTLTLLFALSAHFWRYASDADAYVLSLAWLLLAFYFLGRNRASVVQVGLAHVGAMLVHQLAVWFFPAAMVGMYRKRGWRGVAGYSAIAIGITLAAYYAGFVLQTKTSSPRLFLHWVTSHADDVTFSFSLGKNLARSAVSYVRLFLGGKTSAVAEFFGPFMIIALIALAAALLALVVQLMRYRQDLRLLFSGGPVQPGSADNSRRFEIEAVVWLASYAIFLLFWLPYNTFYKIFCLPAFIILATGWLDRRRVPRHYRLALLVTAMAMGNLAFSVFPNAHVAANPAVNIATQLNRLWSNRTVVYYQEQNIDDWYIHYLNPQAIWKQIPSSDPDTFAQVAAADAAHGREVWLDRSALDALSSHSQGSPLPIDSAQPYRDVKHVWRGFYRWHVPAAEALRQTQSN